jgi:hypothetical protein
MVMVAATPTAAQEAGGADDGSAAAADTRTQFPAFLLNSYFSVSVGSIAYGFSERQLEPGFSAQSIAVPHPAVRVALFGHEFNQYLSLQCTYLRPVRYVTYRDAGGELATHHVFTHFGGLTAKGRLPVTSRIALYGEGGLGVTSRRGFSFNGVPIVRDAHYASILVGGGVEYHLDPAWDLTAGVTFSPSDTEEREPAATFVSAGFRYTMRPLPPEVVEANRRPRSVFPEGLVQVEYATGVGYGINTFLSTKVPIFWGGNVKVDRGIGAHYERNVFHTAKIFALDFGASVSTWRSKGNHDGFSTVSVYPLFRFTLLRTKPADFYVSYSLAGPTYISRLTLDDLDTGDHFTFQDFMGVGVFLGKNRHLTASMKINHYSNGNIFTHNAGIKIPLTFGLGYVF